MSYLDLTPEEAEARSNAKARVRQSKRPEAVDLSDDPFVRAWQQWDAAPAAEETAEAYLVETQRLADSIGVTTSQFTKRVVSALLAHEPPPMLDRYYVWPTAAREDALASVLAAH